MAGSTCEAPADKSVVFRFPGDGQRHPEHVWICDSCDPDFKHLSQIATIKNLEPGDIVRITHRFVAYSEDSEEITYLPVERVEQKEGEYHIHGRNFHLVATKEAIGMELVGRVPQKVVSVEYAEGDEHLSKVI